MKQSMGTGILKKMVESQQEASQANGESIPLYQVVWKENENSSRR
jgi:hypothetical protein